jgi:hypothetical protein
VSEILRINGSEHEDYESLDQRLKGTGRRKEGRPNFHLFRAVLPNDSPKGLC